MSYQVLARKWRPQQFAQLVGQQHVKTALANALGSNRLHHAYLFTGTRGVGKTTIARIFAKSLNCETGVTATPCGECSACLEIDAGNFVDLLEIDAASRTKVEDTRDLLDNVQYAPSRGRYKVYLIDEVHMLSRHSFNALLKTLEEPPPHVKFLLATTDPQKLPVTVLSRCLQFSLKALTTEQIHQHLAFVLQQEHIPYQDEALALLAKAAKGSLRDSLSLTDQAIAQSNANIEADVIRNMLGLLDQRFAEQLLQAVLTRDMAQLQQQLAAVASQQAELSQVLDDMLSLLHLAALTQLQPAAAQLAAEPAFIQQLASTQSPEALQLYYQLLISGKRELPYAPDPFTGLQMSLLRALAFVPQAADAPVLANSQTAQPKVMASSAPAVQQHRQPEASSVQAPLTETPLAEAPMAEPFDTLPPNVSDSADAAAPGMNSLTLSILQRRGVTSTTAMAPQVPPAKKSERPLAPAMPVVNASRVVKEVLQPEQPAKPFVAEQENGDDAHANSRFVSNVENSADDSFDTSADNDLAEQQQLTESLWQQVYDNTERAQFSDEINEQNFSIRYAAEVDSWAALIERLAIGGLMRLFLLHSAMELQHNQLHLTVASSQQHLDTPEFRLTLQRLLEPALQRQLQLTIVYQSEVAQSPLAIQQRIEQERRHYVSRLLQQDPNILLLQQQFQASLLPDSLQVS